MKKHLVNRILFDNKNTSHKPLRFVFIDATFPLVAYHVEPKTRSDIVFLDKSLFASYSDETIWALIGEGKAYFRINRRLFRFLKMLFAFLHLPLLITDPFGRIGRLSGSVDYLPDGTNTYFLLDKRGIPYSVAAFERFASLGKRDNVGSKTFILGSNHVEKGMISPEDYLAIIQYLVKVMPTEAIYIPHGREVFVPSIKDFPLERTTANVPIEFRLLTCNELPSQIFTFTSTAIMSLKLLFPSIKITWIDISDRWFIDSTIGSEGDDVITYHDLSYYIGRFLIDHDLEVSVLKL